MGPSSFFSWCITPSTYTKKVSYTMVIIVLNPACSKAWVLQIILSAPLATDRVVPGLNLIGIKEKRNMMTKLNDQNMHLKCSCSSRFEFLDV